MDDFSLLGYIGGNDYIFYAPLYKFNGYDSTRVIIPILNKDKYNIYIKSITGYGATGDFVNKITMSSKNIFYVDNSKYSGVIPADGRFDKSVLSIIVEITPII